MQTPRSTRFGMRHRRSRAAAAGATALGVLAGVGVVAATPSATAPAPAATAAAPAAGTVRPGSASSTAGVGAVTAIAHTTTRGS